MTTVRRSLAYSLADNYLGVVLQLLSTLVISRLLNPTEIGIFAVAAVLSSLASTFRDFGVAEYLIQEKELTADKIRASLAANIGVSWLMAALLFFGSSWVGEFYRQDGVTDVLRVLSLNFLLVPFGAVTMACFRRDMNYRPIFLVNISANIVGFIVVMACALGGLGYMSMAWSSLASIVWTVALANFMRPASMPRWPGLKGIGEVIRFGKQATGIYLFSQAGRSAPEAVIGRVLDMAAVAFYSRANGLMEIFNRTVLRAVMPICLPYFARAARAGEDAKTGYIKALALLTGIGWPFFLFIGLLAYSAIRILYGSQWLDSVPLAQILCLVAAAELPYYLAGEMLIAQGRIDLATKLQFATQCFRLAALALVIPFGLVGACWGLLLAALATGALSHALLHKIVGFRLQHLFEACRSSAMVAVLSFIPAWLLLQAVPLNADNFVRLLLAAAGLSIPVWLLAIRAFKHPLWLEFSTLGGALAQKLKLRKHAA
ncbi:lipopolysaccharide biosynthesis protein [Kinneretia aquatilis]|uniref:lipopolysaccharide biosynthesis protein n=1 Tax=Kinneretia aquatilis TaxID=2070761 RepID=UPI00149533C2|nr:lipopolysaccharide biosynthesis protein [Paucibacter aquatile]WIV95931.1 lipopolysaccharide biosynthesis protein [Paucibacter aquatile]